MYKFQSFYFDRFCNTLLPLPDPFGPFGSTTIHSSSQERKTGKKEDDNQKGGAQMVTVFSDLW
jgi:hypothetical protein